MIGSVVVVQLLGFCLYKGSGYIILYLYSAAYKRVFFLIKLLHQIRAMYPAPLNPNPAPVKRKMQDVV